MVIILTAFLAAAQSLRIDRTALELQSRAEALAPRARTTTPARIQPGPRKPVAEPTRSAAVRPGPTAAQRRTQPRRATSGGPLDLASITTICRAAGNQNDPAAFI